MPHPEGMYDNTDRIAAEVAAGRHRDIIGGLWDEMGQLQLDFLKGQGLKPEHRLLDVGCGSLRAGIHFVRYLDPARYYGLDVSQALLDAGYRNEITPLGLAARLPRANLLTVGDFNATSFGVPFDYAIAQSVFTHLPLNLVALALEETARVMKPGGTFFATFFRAPDDAHWSDRVTHQPGGITTTAVSDPYHYRLADMRHAAGPDWEPVYVGQWSHPRGQQMMAYRRR